MTTLEKIRAEIANLTFDCISGMVNQYAVLQIIDKYAEQEQKTGHWIEHERNGITHIECSECSSWFLRSHLVRNSFCPNCGARMFEPQESEDE